MEFLSTMTAYIGVVVVAAVAVVVVVAVAVAFSRGTRKIAVFQLFFVVLFDYDKRRKTAVFQKIIFRVHGPRRDPIRDDGMGISVLLSVSKTEQK